jgi:hypothetical protein
MTSIACHKAQQLERGGAAVASSRCREMTQEVVGGFSAGPKWGLCELCAQALWAVNGGAGGEGVIQRALGGGGGGGAGIQGTPPSEVPLKD